MHDSPHWPHPDPTLSHPVIIYIVDTLCIIDFYRNLDYWVFGALLNACVPHSPYLSPAAWSDKASAGSSTEWNYLPVLSEPWRLAEMAFCSSYSPIYSYIMGAPCLPELRAEREKDSFGVIQGEKKMRGWRMCCISQVAVPGTNALGSTDCEGGREVTG